MVDFWRNDRYEAFEKEALGDPLRGLARKDFPWLLAETTAPDVSGDMWKINIYCLGFLPQGGAEIGLAHLQSAAHCLLSDERLRILGFDPERLTALDLSHGKELRWSRELRVRTKLADLPAVAEKFLRQQTQQLGARFDIVQKSALVKELLTKRPLSRFAEDDDPFTSSPS